jgi:ABC-type multidrug transport system ATPase subunit
VTSTGPAKRKATRPPLLKLEGVSRRYGERDALHPMDLTLRPGRCVALLGPNGSGKSTLLRIAGGRDTPTTGVVKLDGTKLLDDDPRVRAAVAIAGDTVSHYPDLTVREHLYLVAVAHGAGGRADAMVAGALESCRLDDHADAVPGNLSSGQTQALQLAAIMVRPRRLLVLDEPEQRLDPDARRWLAGVLNAEKAAGAAVLLATHHVELAAAVADRVLVLHDGRVTADGDPDEALIDAAL